MLMVLTLKNLPEKAHLIQLFCSNLVQIRVLVALHSTVLHIPHTGSSNLNTHRRKIDQNLLRSNRMKFTEE